MKKGRLEELLYEIGNDETNIPTVITSKAMKKIKNKSINIYVFITSFSIYFLLFFLFIYHMIFSKDSYILKLKANFIGSIITLIIVFAFKNKMCLYLKKLDGQ